MAFQRLATERRAETDGATICPPSLSTLQFQSPVPVSQFQGAGLAVPASANQEGGAKRVEQLS
eukprot:2592700-Pyramimonas_sp.AAC.1